MADNELQSKELEKDGTVHFPLEARVRRTLKFRGKVSGVEYTVTPDDLQRWNWFWERVDRETVCQFTGLKDKNGKEIYEGDICKWWYDEDFFDTGVIRWLKLEYIFSHDGSDNDFIAVPDAKELEIIGNIFENPELIN